MQTIKHIEVRGTKYQLMVDLGNGIGYGIYISKEQARAFEANGVVLVFPN